MYASGSTSDIAFRVLWVHEWNILRLKNVGLLKNIYSPIKNEWFS